MPKKYTSNQQRQAARLAALKRAAEKQLQTRRAGPSRRRIVGRYFRWVVPALGTSQPHVRTLAGDALVRLRETETHLQNYCIATQVHPTTGEYHLDLFLGYSQPVQRTPTYYDRLVGKHGDLSRYRSLNAGVLAYGRKQDPSPLTNFPDDLRVILDRKSLQSSPFDFLYDLMITDPFHFDAMTYIDRNGLAKSLSRTAWSKAVTLLRLQQQAVCNRILRNKPGFRLITRQLIQARLSPQQLRTYDSWSGYAVIVQHLNQIHTYRHRRPMKTLNLLIVGPPNTGKTSLFMNRYHAPHMAPVQGFVPVYKMGVKGWFPQYTSDTYGMILWNEAKLTAYPYGTILQLLEGSAMSLPTKGGFRRKVDNPLVVMTSNMTLESMIRQKFGYNREFVALSRDNLAVRITQVVVPQGYNLFLLQRLLQQQN